MINYFNTQWLKTTRIYFFAVSVCHDSEHSLAGHLWLKVYDEMAAQLLSGAVISSEGSTGWGGSAEFTSSVTHVSVGRLQKLQFQTHSFDFWQASVPRGLLDWKPQFPAEQHRLLQRAAHNMQLASLSTSKQRKREREGGLESIPVMEDIFFL